MAGVEALGSGSRDFTPSFLKVFLVAALALLFGAALLFMIMSSSSTVSTIVGACQRSSEGGGGDAFVSTEPSEEALSDIPGNYLEAYRSAGQEYGLDWAVLAAVGKIESDHGRADYARNAAGCIEGPPTPYGTAKGDMQFIDSSWQIYGRDASDPSAQPGSGDPCKYDDAIYAAAVHLKEGGAPEDYEAGIYSYNHAQWYVDEVMAQAEEYRNAAQEESGEPGGEPQIAAVGAYPALEKITTLAQPLATRQAHAQSGGAEGGVEDARATEFSSTEIRAVELINEFRRQNGLEPLQVSEQISLASAHYAKDMAKYDAYGEPEPHVSGPSDYYPEGADLKVRLNNEGYFAGAYGENIASGQPSAEDVVQSWKDSPGHREMMLNPEMTTIGIGLVENPDTEYGEFWVTNFGDEADSTAKPVSELGSASESGGDGGGGSPDSSPGDSVEGQDAVFPLAGDHADDYEDGWGAERPGGRGHEGTDIMAPAGTEIRALVGGTVRSAEGSNGNDYSETGGYNIMIEAGYDAGPIKEGDRLYYAHMQEPPAVEAGDEVEAGDVIGLVGDTGYGPEVTTGEMPAHLHLGWYDPSGNRAEAESGAMNPFPMLNWLEENGGEVEGGGSGSEATATACPTSGSSGGSSGGASGTPTSGKGADRYPAENVPEGGTGQNGITPLNNWDLVQNEKKIMTYYSKTKFDSYLQDAVGEWNALGGVKLIPAETEAEANVVVFDGDSLGWAWGYTDGNANDKGTIEINESKVTRSASETNRKSLMVHELGHALGLDHANDRPSVMNQNLQTAVPNEYDREIYHRTWGGG